jgi:hypothetical protein
MTRVTHLIGVWLGVRSVSDVILKTEAFLSNIKMWPVITSLMQIDRCCNFNIQQVIFTWLLTQSA